MFRKLVKTVIPKNLFRAIEPYGHWCEAILANTVYGFPARNLKVIGVTGTDGKTTTSTLIYTMLNEAGIKTGLMTTIGYGVPDNWHENYVHMTSVPSFTLMKRIKELKTEGIEWLVLETTSHALAQHRVWGVPYSVAVMTNVAHEHLDYHGSFERYRDAKLQLFKLTDRNHQGLRLGVANAEDPSGELFAAAVKHPITYGLKIGKLRAEQVHSTATGSSFEAHYGERIINIKLKLPGKFNVSNALAATGVGIGLKLSDEQIAKGLAALTSVEGRMDQIDEGQDFDVIVDFAHTPQSFEKILSDLAKITHGRLIAVFGSAGRRDEAKRAIQGELAGQYADMVVVTEEDDRDVDGQLIMDQIALGAIKAGKSKGQDLFLVHDRSQAIQFAIDKARADDTVVLLGKGHEKTIEGPSGERPWDEMAEARKAIQGRLSHEA